MEVLLNWLEYSADIRQQTKVRHKLKDILVIVLFATLANADDWVEIALFAETYQDYLRNYIELKHGVPSHDTINRVMGMISPDILQQLYSKWQEFLNRKEGDTYCFGVEQGRWFLSGTEGSRGKKQRNYGNPQTVGTNSDQRPGCYDRCDGNAERNCGENPSEEGRLRSCGKGEPEKSL